MQLLHTVEGKLLFVDDPRCGGKVRSAAFALSHMIAPSFLQLQQNSTKLKTDGSTDRNVCFSTYLKQTSLFHNYNFLQCLLKVTTPWICFQFWFNKKVLFLFLFLLIWAFFCSPSNTPALATGVQRLPAVPSYFRFKNYNT